MSETPTGPVQSVLVVDDAGDIHDLVEARLRPEGVAIQHAFDAERALAAARASRPDLVLLDLELPGASGLELCRRFKADPDLAAIPVIFLTGTVDVDVKVQAFDAGAIDYVVKPFDAVELRARVRSALRTKRYQDLLATRAQLDGLTGLWNRAYFDERLDEEAAHALRHRRPLGLVLLDVDHFKKLNDAHGHPFGDLVLRRVADVLASTARRGEIPCRYGGEEFGVILRDTDAAGAAVVAERLRARIEALGVTNGGVAVPVTASVGYGAPEDLPDPGAWAPADLVIAADAALYAAKRAGRNRIHRAGR